MKLHSCTTPGASRKSTHEAAKPAALRFRSYETASVQLHPGVNLIVGENAQGKTNLLESVFYLSTGKSFRTARNQELIRFGAEFADLSCTLFSGGREQSLRAVLFSGRRPRQLYIGGVKQRSAAGLSGVLTTVLFCPDDLLILKAALPEDGRFSIPPCASSGPATRRRWRNIRSCTTANQEF